MIPNYAISSRSYPAARAVLYCYLYVYSRLSILFGWISLSLCYRYTSSMHARIHVTLAIALRATKPWSLEVRTLQHDERRLIFHSSWHAVSLYCYLYVRFAVHSRLGGNTAHAVNCQVFLPPFYPRAVHVISCTRLSPLLFYYEFKGHLLYACRGEPWDIFCTFS